MPEKGIEGGPMAKLRPPRGGDVGLTKLFPVERLFRPAGGMPKRTAIPGRKTTVRGIKRGPRLERTINQQQAWRSASKARDELHRRLVRDVANGGRLPRGKRTVITGATDPSTGLSAAGHNFKAGPDGWGCAEKNALDNLNTLRRQQGKHPDLEPHQVDYTNATNVTDRTGQAVDPPGFEKPICQRMCQGETLPDQYPDGVRYEAGGPWDDLTTHHRRR